MKKIARNTVIYSEDISDNVMGNLRDACKADRRNKREIGRNKDKAKESRLEALYS